MVNIRSCKNKGRRLAKVVREMLLEYAPDLPPQDIAVTPSSVPGPDITMSAKAQSVYPLAIECKNVEQLNVWKAYEQATGHVRLDERPLLVFSRNRSEVMCCLKFEDFLRLIR